MHASVNEGKTPPPSHELQAVIVFGTTFILSLYSHIHVMPRVIQSIVHRYLPVLARLLLYLGKTVSGEAEEDGEALSTSRMEMDDEGNLVVTRPKISGKIKLTYNEDKATEQAMEVDADAYMSELRGQVGVLLQQYCNSVDIDVGVLCFIISA